MAQNKLPSTVAEMLDLGNRILAGLTTQGAALGIVQYTPANYGPKVNALALKQQAFNIARSAFAAAFEPVHAQQALLRAAGLTARKILSISLGDDWSAAWVEPGWPNQTTEVPENLPGLLTLGESLVDFLGRNADFQVDTPKITFTPGVFIGLLDAIRPLQTALAAKETLLGQARDARKTEDRALRTESRGVIALLTSLLDPNSPLWDTFGLNRPGASVTPDMPGLPVLTKLTGGHVLAQTDAVATATYYRWSAQVVGLDPDFRFMGRTQDTMIELADLPASGVLRVKVQAANEAGPGRASAIATITLGA